MDRNGCHPPLAGHPGKVHLTFRCKHWLSQRQKLPHLSTRAQIPLALSNYSTLSKLLAITAYTYRFINNCKKRPETKRTGPLTPSEISNAQTRWVNQSQTEIYSSVIDNITSRSSSLKRMPLVRQLRLFLDIDGLIRCGGRIHL